MELFCSLLLQHLFVMLTRLKGCFYISFFMRGGVGNTGQPNARIFEALRSLWGIFFFLFFLVFIIYFPSL